MDLITHFLHAYGYLAVFLFVALESVGSPLPGETVVIAAALYAGSTHRLNIGLIALVAAIAAIAGDNGGYWLGQHAGSRLVRRYGHWVRLDARKLKVGRYLFARHGGAIVFLGRLITSLRPYAAFFAGLNAIAPLPLSCRRRRGRRGVGGRLLLRRVRPGQRGDTGGNRPHDRRTGDRRPADHHANAGHLPDHAPIEERAAAAVPDPPADSTLQAGHAAAH